MLAKLCMSQTFPGLHTKSQCLFRSVTIWFQDGIFTRGWTLCIFLSLFLITPSNISWFHNYTYYVQFQPPIWGMKRGWVAELKYPHFLWSQCFPVSQIQWALIQCIRGASDSLNRATLYLILYNCWALVFLAAH